MEGSLNIMEMAANEIQEISMLQIKATNERKYLTYILELQNQEVTMREAIHNESVNQFLNIDWMNKQELATLTRPDSSPSISDKLVIRSFLSNSKNHEQSDKISSKVIEPSPKGTTSPQLHSIVSPILDNKQTIQHHSSQLIENKSNTVHQFEIMDNPVLIELTKSVHEAQKSAVQNQEATSRLELIKIENDDRNRIYHWESQSKTITVPSQKRWEDENLRRTIQNINQQQILQFEESEQSSRIQWYEQEVDARNFLIHSRDSFKSMLYKANQKTSKAMAQTLSITEQSELVSRESIIVEENECREGILYGKSRHWEVLMLLQSHLQNAKLSLLTPDIRPKLDKSPKIQERKQDAKTFTQLKKSIDNPFERRENASSTIIPNPKPSNQLSSSAWTDGERRSMEMNDTNMSISWTRKDNEVEVNLMNNSMDEREARGTINTHESLLRLIILIEHSEVLRRSAIFDQQASDRYAIITHKFDDMSKLLRGARLKVEQLEEQSRSEVELLQYWSISKIMTEELQDFRRLVLESQEKLERHKLDLIKFDISDRLQHHTQQKIFFQKLVALSESEMELRLNMTTDEKLFRGLLIQEFENLSRWKIIRNETIMRLALELVALQSDELMRRMLLKQKCNVEWNNMTLLMKKQLEMLRQVELITSLRRRRQVLLGMEAEIRLQIRSAEDSDWKRNIRKFSDILSLIVQEKQTQIVLTEQAQIIQRAYRGYKARKTAQELALYAINREIEDEEDEKRWDIEQDERLHRERMSNDLEKLIEQTVMLFRAMRPSRVPSASGSVALSRRRSFLNNRPMSVADDVPSLFLPVTPSIFTKPHIPLQDSPSTSTPSTSRSNQLGYPHNHMIDQNSEFMQFKLAVYQSKDWKERRSPRGGIEYYNTTTMEILNHQPEEWNFIERYAHKKNWFIEVKEENLRSNISQLEREERRSIWKKLEKIKPSIFPDADTPVFKY
eukprot:NODE_196_length_3259_cov_34.834821_g169_i0.p1 GENE.NODE_196_length_3259_cov_34.834821_g169_i0~~NODE_196_length_3259_cov_34.834821_g169_i0.p1  ORF type:complete len:960 (-),score=195.47 NODE_196_length_3259_cov_34.834821_g169_i0:83-2962(-)